MKLLTDEEIDAHWWATAAGGVKGLAFGSLISLGLFKLGARKYPGFPKNLSYSIRTAIAISPPTVATVIAAEESSNAFDYEMYSGSEGKRRLEEYNEWAKKPISEKLLQGAISHKYKIIVGAWAASMWGSWVLVDRDPIMTKAQKIVQARMYAQFLTVGLLLGSIGLSMYDEKHHPEHYVKKDKLSDWERILQEEEERKAQEKLSQGGYKRTRIYKD